MEIIKQFQPKPAQTGRSVFSSEPLCAKNGTTLQIQTLLPRHNIGANRAEKSGCRATGIRFSSGVQQTQRFLKYWLPVLVWMVVVFSASADRNSYQHSSNLFEPLFHWLFPWVSHDHIEVIHHVFRKCGHLTEYAILALLLWRAIHQPERNRPRPWRWDEAGLTLSIVLLYAASDEIHQVYVAGRTALTSDVAIDTSGGAAGLALLWLGKKIFNRRMT
jgi:VanZ family protein